jgi:dihydroneopterin triphosphate diphosphatase
LPEILSKYIECYVYKIFDNEVKYLLLKRSKEKEPYPGIWQIVTGRIEPNEEAYKTALREVQEETGLKPVKCFVAPKVNQFYTSYGDKIFLIPVFVINVESKNVILSDEHTLYEWLSFENAFKRIHWYSQKENLQIINEILSGKIENTMVEITNK